MKKIITLLLSFMMLVNLATVVLAEEIGAKCGGTIYPTLSEAINAATNGEMVTITGDLAKYDDNVIVKDKSISIDISGFNLTCGSITVENSNLMIKNSGDNGMMTASSVELSSGSMTMNNVTFITTNDVITLPDNGRDKTLIIGSEATYLSKTEETPAIIVRNFAKANVTVNFQGTIGVHDDPAIDAAGDLKLVLGSQSNYTSACGDVYGIFLGSPWWDKFDLSESDTYTIDSI